MVTNDRIDRYDRGGGLMPDIGGAEHELELSDAQVFALRALEGFASGLQASEPRALSIEDPSSLARLMVTASSTVLTATLPDCPYAPPGAGVANRWSTGTPPSLVLRCSHTADDGGPHCWAITGSPTSC